MVQIPGMTVFDRRLPAGANAGPPGNSGPDPAEGGTPPKRLGDYELLAEIARGGMGVVYKAWQISLNRLVALKMILAGQLASPADVQRFRIEAEAAANLDHPHIVPIYEVGEHDGQHYFSMKLVEGSLAQQVPHIVNDARRAAKLLETVARAVHHAHQRGILHRDLKPGNILLDGHGQPHVTDFGLAKMVQKNVAVTQSGAIVGTPSYMAPEQARSEKVLTTAVDVYSLGAVLYELLTGRPPFKAETPLETLSQVVQHEPVPPRQVQPKIPLDLETICLKCLQKQPDRRYTTALALAEDLSLFQSGEPIRARPVRSTERLWRWCRRNPALSILSGSVALLLVMLAIGSVFAFLLHQERTWAQTSEKLAKEKEEETRVLWQRAQNAERESQIRSLLAEARSLRQSGQAGQRLSALEKVAEAAKLNPSPELRLELRNEAIACLARTDARLKRRWKAIPSNASAVAFDSQFQRYAVGDQKGKIVIRRVVDDEEITRLSPSVPAVVGGLRFSSDGHFLFAHYRVPGLHFLFAHYRVPGLHFQLWDLRQREPALVRVQEPIDHAFDFSRASAIFASGRTNGSIALFDCASGRRIKLLSQLRGTVRSLAFSPNGRQIAIVTGNSNDEVQVFDLAEDRVIANFPHPAVQSAIAWRDDGRLLAVACLDQRIYVWDVVKQRLQSVLEGHANAGIGIAFSHDRDFLVSWAWDGTILFWDAVRGQQLLRIPAGFPDVGADRQLAVWNGEQLELWELIGGECRVLHHGLVGNRTPRPYDWGPGGVDYSPDGRLLASAGSNGVQLGDQATGTELAQLSTDFWERALFHPSGTSLLTRNRRGDLLRWSIQLDQARGVLQVGSPQWLDLRDTRKHTQVWRDKDIQVWRDNKGLSVGLLDRANHLAFVINVDKPAERLVLGPHRSIDCIARSPDGQWVVTGASTDSSIKVWDAIHGRLVKELHCDFSELAFSADSHWMITRKGSDHRLWQVGSWEPGLAFRSKQWHGIEGLAVTPDSGLMAISSYPDARYIKLIQPNTGDEIATLEAPDPKPYTTLRFSPDGSQLAAATADYVIHLWDLRAIRRQLAAIGLDWEAPANLPLKDRSTVQPIQVKVEPGDLASLSSRPKANSEKLHAALRLYSLQIGLTPYHPEPYRLRGHVHHYLGQFQKATDDFSEALRWQSSSPKRRSLLYEVRAENYLRLKLHAEAVADLQKALELNADNPSACNTLAWLYVVGPEELRDPTKALCLAQKAVKLKPAEETYFNTLGVVHYRLGQYPPAVVWLERSLRKSRHSPAAASDLFFLAMCHARLGDADQARDCYHQALQCVQEKQGQLSPNAREELNAFRAEADAVLAKVRRP
jgi:serine/threonine protein kinase/WD40 repeat protein/tetratricopeptide (TPR) repeat protein